MDLASALKTARKQRGWTQSEVAAKLGVDQRSLRSWENGATTPRPTAIAALEGVYGRTFPRPGAALPDVDLGDLAPLEGQTLAEYIKDAAAARGIDTTTALAKRVGISWITASNLLAGASETAEVTLEKVAAGLGLPLDVLLRLASRPARPDSPWVPPAVSAKFPPRVRAALDTLVVEMAAYFPEPTPAPRSSGNGDGPDTPAEGTSGPS